MTGARRTAAEGQELGQRYLPAVDGLRVVAALMIVVVHLAGVTGFSTPFIDRFSVGIPVFFVISAYLLYRPWAAAALDDAPSPAVLPYYWHRFLRIAPAYWVLVVASVLAFYPWLLEQPERLARILLLQHIVVVGDMPDDGIPLIGTLTPTWSLATEVHFYVLLPVFAVVLRRLLTSRHRVAGALGLLVVVEVLNVLWWHRVLERSFYEQTYWWWLPGYLRYFAIGMILAALSVHAARSDGPSLAHRVVSRAPWVWWAGALLAHAVGALVLPPDPLTLPGQYVDMLVVVGLATPVVLAPDTGPGRLLRAPVAAWLGRISYGIFLWHMFVLLLLMRVLDAELGSLGVVGFLALLPVATAASVLLGWVSFRLVEDPLRRQLRRRPPRASQGA